MYFHDNTKAEGGSQYSVCVAPTDPHGAFIVDHGQRGRLAHTAIGIMLAPEDRVRAEDGDFSTMHQFFQRVGERFDLFRIVNAIGMVNVANPQTGKFAPEAVQEFQEVAAVRMVLIPNRPVEPRQTA